VSRLLLWRHGQTEWNATNRVQGHSDVALDATGRAQAAAAAEILAAQRPDVIVSSDLLRAAATADALAAVTGLPVRTDARLRERYFGTWQGMTGAEIAAAYPEADRRWRRGEPIGDFDIEDVDDLAKRVAAAVQDAVALAGSGTVVLVTHGGAAKFVLGELLGWPPEVVRRIGGLSNCHWTELRDEALRGWTLRAHNVGVPHHD
jgi:probable phosphoglycerate mutase